MIWNALFGQSKRAIAASADARTGLPICWRYGRRPAFYEDFVQHLDAGHAVEQRICSLASDWWASCPQSAALA